jgi:hypothetical protein
MWDEDGRDLNTLAQFTTQVMPTSINSIISISIQYHPIHCLLWQAERK